MNDQTTNIRRYFGAGEQSRGMSADGGAIAGQVPLAMLSVVAGRCYEALRRLTVERVQRSCGGFSEDDISWQAGLWECGEAIDELMEAGWVRFTGFDDVEEDGVPCHALVDEVPVGMQAGETRYGERGLVALEVVGVPVRRVPAMDDELSALWSRLKRLEEFSEMLLEEREFDLWHLLSRRWGKVNRRADEIWRRWAERGSERLCSSLVVWGSHGGCGGHGGGVRNVLGKGGVA